MNKQLLFKVAVVMAAMLSSYGVFAQTQITNEEELRSMATNPSGEYVLANDIVLTGEWTPVGTEAAPFTGKFDGAGHAVKGLVVNQDAGFLVFSDACQAPPSAMSVSSRLTYAVKTMSVSQ